MRTRVSQSFILAVAILAGAGCDNSPPSDSNLVSAAVDPCSPPIEPAMIFYDEKGEPSEHTPALSGLELRRVVAKVAEKTSDPIWFIRVKPSLDSSQRGRVIVYLVPEEQTPRIRTGHAYALLDEGKQTSIYGLSEYIQVSKPDQPFGQLTLPSASELPFAPPEVVDPDTKKSPQMSEEEVTGIVDLVRRPSIYKSVTLAPQAERERMARGAQELPILEIRQYRDTIHVTLGYQHGAEWGYGQDLTLKRTLSGYEVVDWSIWIS